MKDLSGSGYAYIQRASSCGIRFGDRVMVKRSAKDFEDGWDDVWEPEMHEYVGRICKVLSEDTGAGFKLDALPGKDDNDTFYFPYFVLCKVDRDGEIDDEGIPVDTIIAKLRAIFPHGHPDFIPMTVREMELHSRKNHDYAHGGKPTGNFDRVAKIVGMYPGLDISKPHNVAIMFLMKQLDAALWMESQGHKAAVQGVDERWEDISVYAKIIRLLLKEAGDGTK